MTTVNELKLLRTVLSQDRILFTIQQHASRPSTNIRVDCFASNGSGSLGLMKITSLVASTLKYRKTARGLILNNEEDIDRNLVAALSQKLELDLRHIKVI